MTEISIIEEWLHELKGNSEVRVPSINEAILVASIAKVRGTFDLFRGHTNAEWRLTSTAERLDPEVVEYSRQRIDRFFRWANNRPVEMESYLDNEDKLWAIAQHYGLPTRFIDFTSDPKVAAFFSSDYNDEISPPSEAAILCLNSTNFKTFWDLSVWDTMQLAPDQRPEIIELDVTNLWRLQAQSGCFLWTCIHGIEDFYPSIGRIIFPFTRSHKSIPKKEAIYPSNQSSLEILLHQFFQYEKICVWNEFAKDSGHFQIISFGSTPERCFDKWRPEEIPIDPQWKFSENWSEAPNESFDNTYPGYLISIRPSGSFNSFASQLITKFAAELIAENRLCGLTFEGEDELDPNSHHCKLISCARRLWNGMRILPFSAEEISISMTACIGYCVDRKRFGESHKPFGNSAIHVEMKSSADDGSYGRAYVSETGVSKAASSEFLIAAKAFTGVADDDLAFAAIQLPAKPFERFTFSGLRDLMVLEIIPTQLAWRGDFVGGHGLATPLFFSPKSFIGFGLA